MKIVFCLAFHPLLSSKGSIISHLFQNQSVQKFFLLRFRCKRIALPEISV